MEQHEMILPTPVLVLEDDISMQQRAENLLIELGYKKKDFIFSQSIQDAKYQISQHQIGLALIDLGLPDGSGLEIISLLNQLNPDIPSLIISTCNTQETILHAIKNGATGYFLKERDDFEILLSIRSVIRGGAPIDPFIAQRILEKISFQSIEKDTNTVQNDLLSKREKEILNLVSLGMSNREIAESLFLSKYTIECHIKNIYRKLSVSNRSKAIHTARNLGLLA
ncbi:DNA-binding response regulator [Acinetobacter sp. Ac_877]|uniref:response regulator transcription factor n=1 Tax=Acinetobacter portensis TaxID=1839785 RepID=UPI00128BDE0A|nr:LuxR C-terminal-related transcriptional regulator [Acinetobacter portensis]MPW42348.1 DNA-binding response regulator [Acinetobacter portensis]